jgi:3-methylfumaryl-CoA hydratase
MTGEWDAWIGRSETRTDTVDPVRLAKWLATFDREAPSDGTAPQGFHWCLCTPDEPTGALDADGHPRRGEGEGFLPPIPLARRMWAASALEFHAPLRIGHPVERRSTIRSIASKAGASGELVFVEIEHEVRSAGQMAIRERQALVYRCVTQVGPARNPQTRTHEVPGTIQRIVTPSAPLHFRFSALTFNSHRIHYDLPYATEVEGYPGLVVHGPLTATLLMDLVRRDHGDHALIAFEFRGVSPALVDEPLSLRLDRVDDRIRLSATAGEDRIVMEASGRLG